MPQPRLADEYRRPVSVLVLVFTPEGRVLLLRRKRPADVWQSVTGSLQQHESHREAAARELREETGFTDTSALTFIGKSRAYTVDLRWAHRYAPHVVKNVEFEWHYPVPVPADITLDRSEHAEFAWMSLDEAIDAVWSWTNRDALVELRDRL